MVRNDGGFLGRADGRVVAGEGGAGRAAFEARRGGALWVFGGSFF